MEVEQISLELPQMPEEADAQAPEALEQSKAACEETDESTEHEAPEVSQDRATIEALQARVLELEDALAARKALSDRMTRECEEFESYFPEVSLRTLPDEVWGQVRAGVPLAAAYALYERGLCNQARAAEAQNARNAAHLRLFHAGLVKTVCKRYGKSIHGKSDAQQYAFTDKQKQTLHVTSLNTPHVPPLVPRR